MFKVIKEGSSFTSYMTDMKFKAILTSETDSYKIKDIAKSYKTAN